MTEIEAKRIAQRYLAENTLEHPDYEWDLREWIEQTDGGVFPFCVRCKRDIPQDEWEQFGGAPAFLVRKGDGAVKVLSWSEYQEAKQGDLSTM